MKKKYSAEQREQLLLEWKASGMSAPKWCRKMRIPYQTLAHWRQTISSSPTTPSFIEVVDKPSNLSQGYLEVFYANARIRLNFSSEETVRAFLKVLRSLE